MTTNLLLKLNSTKYYNISPVMRMRDNSPGLRPRHGPGDHIINPRCPKTLLKAPCLYIDCISPVLRCPGTIFTRWAANRNSDHCGPVSCPKLYRRLVPPALIVRSVGYLNDGHRPCLLEMCSLRLFIVATISPLRFTVRLAIFRSRAFSLYRGL